jgi:serralysin
MTIKKISIGSSGLLNVALDLASINYSYYDLSVYNSSGTLLGTLNTYTDGNLNFTVSSAGTYYVSVDSYFTAQYGFTLTETASGSGTYKSDSSDNGSGRSNTSTGSVTAVAPSSNAGTAYAISSLEKPTNGKNKYIDALALNSQWANNDGSTGTIEITYCTVHGSDPYSIPALNSVGDVWSESYLDALSGAMSSWEAVTNIDFVETSNSTEADIWYWSVDTYEFYAWHDFPASDSYYSPETVNYSALSNLDDSTELGGYMYSTLVHELGHGLGLAHPHDGGGSNGGTTFPGVKSPYSIGTNGLNQGIWTVMSYNEGWQQEPSSSSYYGDVIGPMAFDIATIQKKYGANISYETGSNTYLLPTINASGTGWACIWDAGGTDTISNSGSSTGCTINLNAAPLSGLNAGGYVSWNSGISGGFTIANGVTIENAIGGNGSDQLTGNSANNSLTGGDGSDTFIFNTKLGTSSWDTITDFNVLDDTIWLENTGVFAALNKVGILSTGAYYEGVAAHDKDDRIIYNSSTGSLSYDVDGSGKRAAVQFATLTTGLALTNADFWVI